MGIVLFASFFALIAMSVPIAIALGLSSVIALSLFSHTSLMVIVQKVYGGADSFTLMAIPFFILAGNVMSSGGVSRRLVDLAGSLLGRMTGGLAQVTTVACTFFGSISGSAPATTAAIGSVMVKPMEEKGYDPAFAAAVAASSGTIGLLIPPSITLVIYGVITGTSIAKLFMGGVLPGLLMTAAIMAVNHIICVRHGHRGGDAFSASAVATSARRSFFALLMPVIILGGIYGGVFTPTEAAVVAVFYGLLVGLYIHRELKHGQIPGILLETGKSTAVIMFLIATAHIFSYILASEQIPQKLTVAMLNISHDPHALLAMVVISLMVVGTFLDNAVAVVLMTPIFYPLTIQAGIDPIFFGVLMILTLAIGQITPPVGLCLFVACNITKVSIESLSLRVVPYVIALLVVVACLVIFPDIVLFIPNSMDL
ncbi:TRAP transporter large permease [Oleispirillum naphthae]|uniref:TRAP transporter large permease n=1 Tax=Oleispirillum naphthae TaxID=2838853 RepID=UPI00308263FF